MIRWILLICLALLSGCNSEQRSQDIQSNNNPVSQMRGVPIDSTEFTTHLGTLAYTHLSKADQAAQILDDALSRFMHHPNPATQKEVQQAWHSAYDGFLETLIYSYLPIKEPAEWNSQHIAYSHLLIQLDSSPIPIEGGYIDYLEDYPFSGIVNDLTLTINEDSIRTQHGFTDSSNASLGYHALEFMLWGENPDGQSMRSAQDFIPQENTVPVPLSDSTFILSNPHSDHFSNKNALIDADPALLPTDISREEEAAKGLPEDSIAPPIMVSQNHNRRRQYTQLIAKLLLNDLHKIQQRWEPSSGYYSHVLKQGSDQDILRAVFIAGQDLLSKEILTKRFQMTHSKFSHRHHDDLLALLAGFEHWFMPASSEDLTKHPNIFSVIQQVNKPLSTTFAKALLKSKTCIQSISAGASHTIDQCKQDTIQLLSQLRHVAKALSINLPALD